MRICLIVSVPLPPEEGIGYHIWNLAQQLVARGHEVSVITRGGLAPTSEIFIDNVRVWHVPFAPVYPFHIHLHGIFVNRFFTQIEDKFDVINIHTPLPPHINTCLPIVATVHSPMLLDTGNTSDYHIRTLALRAFTPVMTGIERAIFTRSQTVTTVANWVAKALEVYDLDPKEVVVTGNGVETGFIRSFYTGQRKPYVLYVGRLDIGKGLEELIQAAKIIVTQCPDWKSRFVLVGKGPLLETLKNKVVEYGLEKHVQFYGHLGLDKRDKLIELYQKALAFVLPSHHEGMPTVLLEAMAIGTPSISTAVGGALEFVNDSENALLVPPRAPDKLAEAIIGLYSDADLRAKLGHKGHETVRKRFSWSAIADRYLECYEQVLQSRRHR